VGWCVAGVMDKLRILGGQALSGSIQIAGAKNASLPVMAASVLTDQNLVLRNLPRVADIATMGKLLVELGLTVSNENRGFEGNDLAQPMAATPLVLNARNLESVTASYDLVRKMRASVLVLGPLLARLGYACVSMPGGCAIGPRPVDLHVAGLERLGARISLKDGYIEASAPKGLKGAVIELPLASVGATENLMMAATLARGDTVILNAAREPEVVDLAHCLRKMGAQIGGIGTSRVEISGVDRLEGADHTVVPDRIESGTYAIAAAITGGTIDLLGARLELMDSVKESLAMAGVGLVSVKGGVRASRVNTGIYPLDVETHPYPGFPTDMQAQLMALMTLANGVSRITEKIFENRFMHVNELSRMGAKISIQGNQATVVGVRQLTGAQVMATDLRASVSLLLAGLAARGETVVNRVYHLDRGYELVVEKLVACGATVERLPK
jgi:UDP-N-acetylglucosamine 1-carboxyvinyltransferase